MMETQSYLPIAEAPGLFVDAAIADDVRNAIFLSVWGRDTSVQEFIARLSLPVNEGGLKDISFGRSPNVTQISFGDTNDLSKATARSTQQTVFGELINLWLYKKRVVEPDLANGHAILLYAEGNKPAEIYGRVWQLVKQLSRIPLMDHWQEPIIECCLNREALKHRAGMQVSMFELRLNHDEFECDVQKLLRQGKLTNDPDVAPSVTDKTEELFTADDVIHSYSRAEALDDGFLIDVSGVAKEAGFKYPVALTTAVWEDCVRWDAGDTDKQTGQDQSGRLWDVVYMAAHAAKRSPPGNSVIVYDIHRVPRDGKSKRPSLVKLKSHCGPGDDAKPVITIMFPHED